MSDRSLIASLVLFSELYDKNKDIYDVVAEFIKSSIIFRRKWVLTSTEAVSLLETEFGLNIPEAVVSTTLSKRLKRRDGILSFQNGHYHVAQEKIEGAKTLIKNLEVVTKNQKNLLDKFLSYVESRQGNLNDHQKSNLIESFSSYLFDSKTASKNIEIISSFIIKNQHDSGFTAQLNAVREGFVLYDGLQHSPDANKISSWQDELYVYLDTEHLFNAIGLNGELHKQLFKDFLSLSSEPRSKGKRIIKLKYLSESSQEIDRFFHMAEHIVEGKATLDPSKIAMTNIVNGCHTKSEVLAKKAFFISKLKEFGITEESISISDIEHSHNIGGRDFLSKIKLETEENGIDYSEDKCTATLQMLSKINFFRKGNHSGPFESIGHIFVSASGISRRLAFHPEIWPGEGSIPLSTDLEFITNRIWFKLKIGLAKETTHPQSLNVLAKSQVVLSSQINNAVYEKFEQTKKDFEEKKIDKDSAQILLNELRSKAVTPEELNAEYVDAALAVIDHRDYSIYLRENEILKRKALEGDFAIKTLDRIRESESIKEKNKAKKISIFAHSLLTLTSIFIFIYLLIKLTSAFSTNNDTPLSKISFIITLAALLLPLFALNKILFFIKKSHTNFVIWLIKKNTQNKAI